MPVGKGVYAGSPYLGVYLRANDTVGLAPPNCPGDLLRAFERILGVSVVQTTMADSEVVGSLVALNAHGALLSDEVRSEESVVLEGILPVTIFKSRLNALGNTVLANDTGAVVHPEYTDDEVSTIARALGVPAVRSTLAGLGTVGMAGVVTALGVVVHPRATPEEVATVEKALGVPAHRSTANFGIPLVGACLVANRRGILVGDLTTPVELVHLQEGLKVYH